jgi:SnoaL-like domain
MSNQTDLDALLAKEDIRTLSRQYMRGLDRLDADLLGSVFFDDARVDYGFYRGSAQQFVEFAMRALRDHHANHHFIGQMSVDLEGDVAFGEIYFQAFHRLVDAGAEKDLFIAGRYVDRYERRNGIWKIAFRAEVNDWARTDAAADDFFRSAPEALRGARGAADLSSRRDELRRR